MQLCSPTVQLHYTLGAIAKLCAKALQKHFFTKYSDIFSFGDLPSAPVPFKLSNKFNNSCGDRKGKNFSASGDRWPS